MNELIVIFEINGQRRGYRGNQYCVERFFRTILSTGTEIHFIQVFNVDTDTYQKVG